MEPFGVGGVRVGVAYEDDREATRARLAAASGERRVDLGDDLVLVFETAETVRTALEEMLRAQRIADPALVATESDSFGALVGGSSALAAVLFVDIADPVALDDRLAALGGIAELVSLEVDGTRIAARAQSEDDRSGARHVLFPLDAAQRAALLGGAAVAVVVDHPNGRATVALSTAQVHAAAADLAR